MERTGAELDGAVDHDYHHDDHDYDYDTATTDYDIDGERPLERGFLLYRPGVYRWNDSR